MSTSDRVHMARANLATISVALGRAEADGGDIGKAVVLLLDTRDMLAGDLARALFERSPAFDLAAEEARVVSRDQIPTGVAVVPVETASALFGETHPDVSAALKRSPPAGFSRVVVVAAGGATLMHLPVQPPGAVGQA